MHFASYFLQTAKERAGVIFNVFGTWDMGKPRFKGTESWRKAFLAEATFRETFFSIKPNKVAWTEWDKYVSYFVSNRPVAS